MVKFFSSNHILVLQVKALSTKTELQASKEEPVKISQNNEKKSSRQIVDYRFIYPEFLPDPKIEWRNAIREKLERKDMLSRRVHIDIPEFYVGA